MSIAIIKGKTKCGLDIFKPERPIVTTEEMNALNFYQAAIVRYPNLGKLLFHVTNEGKRSYRKGELLKQSGLIKGVSDYVLLMPNKNYSYLCIELKREKGNYADSDQKEFLSQCLAAGGYGCVANGYHAALFVLENYMQNKDL